MSEMLSLHKGNNTEMTERNGISVPAKFAGVEAEYNALRQNVTMADYSHYSKIRVSGDEAFDFLDFAVAGDVAEIRDEQTLYTVLLDEKGEIISDLYVMNDDDSYLLLCEFLSDSDLMAILEARKGEFEVEIVSLTASHAMITFEGPYSWELMTEIYGMDVIGIPYLGFIAMENETWLLRSGKNGEYGYKVILPQADAVQLWKQAEELGAKYNLAKTGLDLQKISRLENPYFNPEGVGKKSRNPRELQLQWMVRYDKEEFFGRDALLESREQPISKKVVGIVSKTEGTEPAVNPGDKVICAGEEIGEVVTAGYSPTLKKYIAQAYLKPEYAYASIDAYSVKTASGKSVDVATSSTPFFMNLSMLVNPNEHSFVNPQKHKNVLEQMKAEGKI